MPSRVALNQVSLRRPGIGVDLDAERRHREGMDHVGAGRQHADDLVHRHHHLVVDGEQARLARLALLVLHHQRVEFELVVRIAVAPEPLLAGRLDGDVGLRHVELQEQQAERRHRDRHQDERPASPSRATSISVLWVVREGTGLARALNFTTTMTSSASTNSVIAVMIQSRKSWNQMMLSITGVAPFCSPSCHGSGWPAVAASAAPADKRRHAHDDECDQPLEHQHRPMRSFDEKNGLLRPLFAAHHWHDVRRGPAEHGICHGRGSLGGAAGRGEIPASQTIIPALPQCTSLSPVMRQTAYPKPAFRHRISGPVPVSAAAPSPGRFA